MQKAGELENTIWYVMKRSNFKNIPTCRFEAILDINKYQISLTNSLHQNNQMNKIWC